MGSERLEDLGERRIIDEILRKRYGQIEGEHFGDDCAFVAQVSHLTGRIVATTDPCPMPMASLLGFTDLYYWGWLLATINLSDLAAAGARPLGLLTSLILRNDTHVDDFIRLLDGIDECCSASSTRVVGGNLKEGEKMDLTATAIGICKTDSTLSRTGCKQDDLFVALGDLGLFWAGVLSLRNGLIPVSEQEVLLRNVLKPTPKVRLAQELASRRLLTACLDNSDGLYPSALQLAHANSCQVCLRFDTVKFTPEVSAAASRLQVDPVRLAVGWGDWQLLVCCDPANLTELINVSQSYGIPATVIGKIRSGAGVMLEYQGTSGQMAEIDSERFTKASWFTSGVDGYISQLIDGPLWKKDL